MSSWYEDSDLAPCPPLRAISLTKKLKGHQPLKDYWEHYAIIISQLTSLCGDESEAAARALTASYARVPSLVQLSNQYRYQQQLRQDRETQYAEAMCLVSPSTSPSPEGSIIASETYDNLVALWEINNDTNVTLPQAVAMEYPGNDAPRPDKRHYHTVKMRLSRLRKLYNDGELN
jgi:hypothetical protein